MAKERKSQVKIKVYTEGLTEYNYIDAFRKSNADVKIQIEPPKQMNGGGYGAFLKFLTKNRLTAGYIAAFVVIDYDRVLSVPGEDAAFEQLLKWCRSTNKSGAVPYFVIVTNPKIEYFACLHCPDYRNSDPDTFIKKTLGYRDLDDFKNDKKVYDKLTSAPNSLKQARQSCCAANDKDRVVFTQYTSKWKGLNFNISVTKIVHQPNNAHMKSTNFNELFAIAFGEGKK